LIFEAHTFLVGLQFRDRMGISAT